MNVDNTIQYNGSLLQTRGPYRRDHGPRMPTWTQHG